MHIFFSMDSLCIVLFFTHLVVSKIVVEAKDESGLSNQTAQPLTTTEADYGDYGCSIEEYQCEPGVCIVTASLCDGIEDCSDGSDETDCPDDYECSDFQCMDGTCIELSAKCDGIEDCPDGADESGCTNTTTCSTDQIACGDNTCIDQTKKCDGVSDCTDGSDETDCTVETTTGVIPTDYYYYGEDCREDQFKCDEDLVAVCLNDVDLCNGFVDCADGTDEMNCSAQTSSAITTRSSFSSTVGGSITASPTQSTTKPSGICGHDSFQCNDGSCISNVNLCNGQNECNDGSDEVGCPTGGSSPIMSAITTNRNSVHCEYKGSTYAPNESIEGDECGGVLCNSSGEIIVWANTTCSALSAKANSLMLGFLTVYGALYVWR